MLLERETFLALPVAFKVPFLGALAEHLRGGLYTIVRFRCLAEKRPLRTGGADGKAAPASGGASASPTPPATPPTAQAASRATLVSLLLGLVRPLSGDRVRHGASCEAAIELIALLGTAGVAVG